MDIRDYDVYYLSTVTSPNPLGVRREGTWMCVPILVSDEKDENGEWVYKEHRANIRHIDEWLKVIPSNVYRLIQEAWLDEQNRLKDVAERLDILESAFMELADLVAESEE